MDAVRKFAHTGFDILKNALRHFDESDGWAMSSHVALSLMISLFPFLIFATSMASFLGSQEQTAGMVKLVFEYWPERIAEPIVREIEIVLNQHNVGFLTVGIGLALFFASNGVEAVRIALNRAYRDEDNRSIFRLRLQSVSLVLLMSVSILAASIFLVLGPEYGIFSAIKDMFRSEAFRLLIAIVILITLVTACHATLPGKRRRLRRIWPGILITLVLWTLCARVFAHYVTAIADYSATYAGLAGIFTALIFLYLMALVLILGAEINAEIERRNR